MADRDQDRDRVHAWNRYQVDPALAGRRVELVLDPLSQSRGKGSKGSPSNRSSAGQAPRREKPDEQALWSPGQQ